jgi:adhesin transport system membrane fusion protein
MIFLNNYNKNQRLHRAFDWVTQGIFMPLKYIVVSEKPFWRRINHGAIIMFVALVLWASFNKVDIAIKATGQTVSYGENKLIRHLEGGIIKDIFVKEGQLVKQGDILFRISNQDNSANMNEKKLELLSLQYQKQRIQAELKNEKPQFIAETKQQEAIIAGELKIFDSRVRERTQNKQTYIDQIQQKRNLLKQQKTQIYNLSQELNTMQKKMQIVQSLVESGAASTSRMLDTQSIIDRLKTEVGVINGQLYVTNSELDEIQSKLNEKETQNRKDLLEEKQKINLSIRQIKERLIADKDRVFREDVTAPVSGTINNLYVNTIGGAVKPSEVLVELIPSDGSIIVNGKVSPKDRAKIWHNQEAKIQISAFDDYQSKPIKGKIIDISADVIKEDSTQEPFYRIKVMPIEKIERTDYRIMPGMDTQIHIVSGKRTIMNYLLDPFKKANKNAFIEN